MYVGCTATMTVTESSDFVAGPLTVSVGGSKYDAYTYYDPTIDANRPWCTIIANTPVDIEISYDGGVSWTASQTAITVAASCNGQSPCNSFDLAQAD